MRSGGWQFSARAIALSVALAAPTLVGSPAAAQSTPPDPPVAADYDTARGMALGLGARASAASTSAISYNAAGLTIGRTYHIESIVGYEPSATRVWFGAAVVDSFSSSLAMGLQYRYVLGNGKDGYSGMEGRLALALPIGDVLAIGVTGRYMSFAREGQVEGDERGPFAEGPNVDASVRVTPVENLHIAALGYNLVDYGTSLVPRLVGGSISYQIAGMVTLAFDGLADLSTFHEDPDGDGNGPLKPEMLLGGAVEVFVSGVPIRAGYSYDSGRALHYVTAGLGYVTPEFGVDVSCRQQVAGGDDTWLLASFRYFVH